VFLLRAPSGGHGADPNQRKSPEISGHIKEILVKYDTIIARLS